MIVIIVAGLVLGSAITATIMLNTGKDVPAGRGGFGVATTPAPPQADSSTDAVDPTSEPTNSGQPAPPAAPTGAPYPPSEQPQVGDCIDTTRTANNKLVLYRADCRDPVTPLVLDKIVADRCAPDGYSSIRDHGKILCFAWNVKKGDCLDLAGPRKSPCGASTVQNSITVTDIMIGGTDGTGCTDPDRWLQAGAGPDRGTACFMPTTMISSSGSTTPR